MPVLFIDSKNQWTQTRKSIFFYIFEYINLLNFTFNVVFEKDNQS